MEDKGHIIVTGGVGYIGSHTVVELLACGYIPIILDSLENSDPVILKGIKKITGITPIFHKVNICSIDAMKESLRDYRNIKGIIHFAAYKAVGESTSEPLKYYKNNVGGVMEILQLMKELKIPNLIFSSSCTVYGQPDTLPVNEQAPIKPAESPYGRTKQMCEDIIHDFVVANNEFRSVSLRYFNPVGAHSSALIGELPQGIPNNLVPFITQTAYGIRKELMVFGSDYDTTDGSCIRDYIHVVDLAKAHITAMDRLITESNKEKFEIFNLGTGRGSSVLEMITAFKEVNKVPLPFIITNRRPGDIEQVWSDTKHANEELGWKAEKGIKEMLQSAWEWEKYYRQNILVEA
ncbi:MAG: UDP-glucose 4-epimerase GalE [Saprospiraceae bacterium]|nr:UDP-glucose 4-epimerase GalE [Bacteroidia bacterium]NNF22780.1 UDP-glucose 4-epimerase GalE [Saprospiraceae bacterium]